MKKYNLNETWRLCLKMWKWIAKEWKKDKSQSVNSLKRQWLNNNGFVFRKIYDDCFFCNYAKRSKNRRYICDYCPGRKIDKSFSCTRDTYDYENCPDKFYKKLLELNRKRKKK